MSNIIFGLVPTRLDICKFANARLNILRLLLLLVKYVFVDIIILVLKIFKILFYATGMNSSGKSISTINFVDDLLDENAVFGGGVIIHIISSSSSFLPANAPRRTQFQNRSAKRY